MNARWIIVLILAGCTMPPQLPAKVKIIEAMPIPPVNIIVVKPVIKQPTRPDPPKILPPDAGL